MLDCYENYTPKNSIYCLNVKCIPNWFSAFFIPLSLIIQYAFSWIPEGDSPPQRVDPVPPDPGGHRWQAHQSIAHLQTNQRDSGHIRNVLEFWPLKAFVTSSHMQLKSIVFVGIIFLHLQTVTQINLTICLISLPKWKTNRIQDSYYYYYQLSAMPIQIMLSDTITNILLSVPFTHLTMFMFISSNVICTVF